MKISYIKYCTFIVLLASTGLSFGQENPKNVLEMDLETSLYQWNKSNNAAGLLIDQPSKHSRLSAGYSAVSGNLKMPQIGQEINTAQLNTSGNLNLNKLYLQGYFNYYREAIKDAEYNASLINPLRQMPYIVADTNASNWLNQHYQLGFKLSSKPIAEKLSLGLSTDYKASSGAKQRDIRAKNNYYELQIKPGIVYSLSAQQHFGANLLYKNFKEESTNSNVNLYVDQGYFFLFGLGNSINYIGAGRVMNYGGDALGAGLQYQYNGEIKVLAAVDYNVQAEDAEIAFTKKRPVGTILQKNWIADLKLQKKSENYSHAIHLNYEHSSANGIEYLTEFQSGLESEGYYVKYKSIRSKYQHQLGHLAYEIVKLHDIAYNWKASLNLDYTKFENNYLIPGSVMKAENLNYGISFNKLFLLTGEKNKQLAIGANANIKKNVNGTYNYQGSSSEKLTVKDLERRNFEFHTADYTQFELPIVYSQRIKESSSTQLFVKAKGQLFTSNSFDFKNRKGFHVSVGATF